MKQRVARWLRRRADRLDPPKSYVDFDPTLWTTSSTMRGVTIRYTDPGGNTRTVGP